MNLCYLTYIHARYDSNANTLLQVSLRIAAPKLYSSRDRTLQMHVCMEMGNIFEAEGKVDEAALHRANAIRYLQTSVLGADCMFVANTPAKNGRMMHKVPSRNARVAELTQSSLFFPGGTAGRGAISLPAVASHKACQGTSAQCPPVTLLKAVGFCSSIAFVPNLTGKTRKSSRN